MLSKQVTHLLLSRAIAVWSARLPGFQSGLQLLSMRPWLAAEPCWLLHSLQRCPMPGVLCRLHLHHLQHWLAARRQQHLYPGCCDKHQWRVISRRHCRRCGGGCGGSNRRCARTLSQGA